MMSGTPLDIAAFLVLAGSMAALVLAGWVIMDPRIHEGLVIKLGLITLSVGAFALLQHVPSLMSTAPTEVAPMLRALAACSAGVLTAGGGLLWRLWRYPEARQAARLVSGWAPLDDQPGLDQ